MNENKLNKYINLRKKKEKILVDMQLYSQTIPEISYLAMLAKKQNTLATPSK